MLDKAGLKQPADKEKETEGAQPEGAGPPIHMPGPSIWPATLGFGVALLLFGILSSWEFSVVGAGVFAWALARWVSQLRLESLEHESGEHESQHGSQGVSTEHDAHA